MCSTAGGDPYGIRTRVAGVRGRSLRPLDQRATTPDYYTRCGGPCQAFFCKKARKCLRPESGYRGVCVIGQHIRVDKPPPLGAVIPRLEPIPISLRIVVISSIAYGVNLCDVLVVGINDYGFAFACRQSCAGSRLSYSQLKPKAQCRTSSISSK